MKLDYIYLDSYKNLKDFEVAFNEGSSVNALIGNNGSGKSNVLEALATAFAAVYNEQTIDFIYDICYRINNSKYRISNRGGTIFTRDGKNVRKAERRFSLPRGIFLYYCGETERLKNISDTYIDKAFSKALKNNGETVLKYISFVGLREFPAAMLANAVYKSNSFENICDLVGIESIGGPVEFVLKRPTWSKSAPITNDSFWNAQGTVAAVLSQLVEMGVLNISNKDSATITVDNIANVRIDSENCFDLFAKLELLLQADILKEIRFNVIKDDVSMQLEMLSEGEKQLAQLLCLLEATKEYRALFLLDEFDSFLHPNWQRRFAEIISEIEITGQVIFTTHSPLTLGKMRKENIRILKDGQVFEPSADTFNRDITEVLEEIMDVGKRPVDVEKAMRDFRNSVIHGNKKDALIHENTLRELLSRDDPFWVTAGHLLSRMGD